MNIETKDLDTLGFRVKAIHGISNDLPPLSTESIHLLKWFISHHECNAYKAYQTVIGNRKFRDIPDPTNTIITPSPHHLTPHQQEAINNILKNHKEESNIQNFQLLQKLQEDIRETLFLLEPISALKAFLSVKNNEKSWNRINPPLTTISDPFNNKTINSLITLIKKMDESLPSACMKIVTCLLRYKILHWF